jgi:hypothetical protein
MIKKGLPRIVKAALSVFYTSSPQPLATQQLSINGDNYCAH